jgi:hypothetical protein
MVPPPVFPTGKCAVHSPPGRNSTTAPGVSHVLEPALVVSACQTAARGAGIVTACMVTMSRRPRSNGDTIRCFLLLLERHPVRSCSCCSLELRLASPLSRRQHEFKSRRGRQQNKTLTNVMAGTKVSCPLPTCAASRCDQCQHKKLPRQRHIPTHAPISSPNRAVRMVTEQWIQKSTIERIRFARRM